MIENNDYREVCKRLQSEIDYRLLGQRMRSVRLKRGFTQSTISEIMRIGEKYYAAIETGIERISLARLIQFICVMQVPADYLLSGCHENYPSNYKYHEDRCQERDQLNNLLDKCSDETIKTIYIITKGLLERQ